MKIVVKRFYLIVLSVICAISMCFVLGNLKAENKAFAASDITTFEMLDGASIRTSDPMGIRFSASISAKDYEVLKAQNAEFGMIIAPKDFYETDEQFEIGKMEKYDPNKTYAEGAKYYNSAIVTPVADEGDFDKDGDLTEYVFKCVFMGIKENNFSRPFSARAYYKVGETVTHSAVVTRAPYTVATKAISADVLETPEAIAYCENIQNKVNEVYTEFKAELAGVTDNTTKYNDTFTVNATVKNPLTGKILEAGTKVVAKKSGVEDPTAIKVNADGSYTVKTLGNFELALTNGTLTEKVVNVTNSDKLELLGSKESLKNVRYYQEKRPMDVTYAGTDIHGNPNQVFKYDINTETWVSDTMMSTAFTFDPEIRNIMKAGRYIYADMYFEKGDYPSYMAIYQDGKKTDDFINGFDNLAVYDVSGNKTGNSIKSNAWNRVEIKIEYDWTNEVYFCIQHFHAAQYYNEPIYISNMYLSDKKIETQSKIPVTEDVTDALLTHPTKDKFELEVVNGIGGRDGVKKFARPASSKEDIHFFSSAHKNKNYVPVNAPENLNPVFEKMNKGTFMYIDVFVPEGPVPEFKIGKRENTEVGDKFETYFVHTNKMESDINHVMVCRLLRKDISDNLIPCDSGWGAYQGQWLTIEIEFLMNTTADGYQNEYRFYLRYAKDQSAEFGSNEKVVYFDNVRLSPMSLVK